MFRRKRSPNPASFIEAMLGNRPLYRTETARLELEARARENLLRSLHALRPS
jgi:predicted metal-dependent HD superfamily phosphohydrolase